MIRREKGFKRYAKQRERAFTDPLIREDELKQVEEIRARMARINKKELGKEEEKCNHDETD